MTDRNETGLFDSALLAADKTVRALANGMTFGLADHIAGMADQYIYNTTGATGTLQDKIARQQALTTQNGPAVNALGNVAGSFMTGAGIGAAMTGVGVLASMRAVRTEAALKQAALAVPPALTKASDAALKIVVAGEAGMAAHLCMQETGIAAPRTPPVPAAPGKARE